MRARIHLRSTRGPITVIIVHSADCEKCVAYVEELVQLQSEIRDWGGHIIVAVRDNSGALRLPHTTDVLQTIDDSDEQLPWRVPAVIVADEWGEVFFDAELDHSFMPAQEVLEWLRFVAIQCPECEHPEGAWREL